MRRVRPSSSRRLRCGQVRFAGGGGGGVVQLQCYAGCRRRPASRQPGHRSALAGQSVRRNRQLQTCVRRRRVRMTGRDFEEVSCVVFGLVTPCCRRCRPLSHRRLVLLKPRARFKHEFQNLEPLMFCFKNAAALWSRGKVDEAIAALRVASRLDPHAQVTCDV